MDNNSIFNNTFTQKEKNIKESITPSDNSSEGNNNERNLKPDNSFQNENKLGLSNNSNSYINSSKININTFPFFTNNINNGNVYNGINPNNNIYINLNNSKINNYQNYNYYILNQNNFLYRDINNYNINNNIYMYNNNGNNLSPNNNKSNYLNKDNFIFQNINNKINEVKTSNNQNNNLNSIRNINLDSNKINLSNFQNNNYNNKNLFDLSDNNMIHDNKLKNNKCINKINNLNPTNIIINSSNENDLNNFAKYLNSLPMKLVNYLCTPKGAMEIQKKLEKLGNEHKILLINYLSKQGLPIIMKNTYGNYFFQQLIKKNGNPLISLIISFISEDFISISEDSSGTFSLQALLNEISSIEEQQQILNCIKNYEMEMAYNKNATHVLKKIVLLFPDRNRIYLNEVILNNFIELCLDSFGICLIKIFMKTNTLIENKKRINNIIVNNFVTLSESPFGNYGIQYLMEIWNKNDLEEIKDKIMENIYKLSLQQFSSNVIEKAIETFNEENRKEIIRKLIFDKNFIIILIKNKFGKFVLNKAIKFMQLDVKNEFELSLINDIVNNFYKNKDKNKIKKLLLKLKNNKFSKNRNIIYNNNFYFNNNNNMYNNVFNNFNNFKSCNGEIIYKKK